MYPARPQTSMRRTPRLSMTPGGAEGGQQEPNTTDVPKQNWSKTSQIIAPLCNVTTGTFPQ